MRRVFFTTSLNNWFWIDFFQNHPKTLGTNSYFGWLKRLDVQVPYQDNISMIIGDLYYNDETTNAASGTIADAYSNLGWLGLIFFPFTLVFIVKLLDKVTLGVNITYIIPIIVTVSIYLLNGSIYTAVVTYGYLFGLLLIYYMNKCNMFVGQNVNILKKES